MTSQSRAESPDLQTLATATVLPPAPWTVLLRLLRSGVSRGWAIVQPRTACMLGGHEKWTAKTGDWVCMRCGKLEILDVPQVPTPLGDLARAGDLPRFD